ncbi:MAG TPA: hypothetical protein VMQ99_00005, partial [Acetobacteraceae bacterium]|nr:hypothetical protein [Acetobacteraceae bacterium]
KIVEPDLLDHAARKPAEDRLVVLVAGIAAASQTVLQQIVSQLDVMRERTPRARNAMAPILRSPFISTGPARRLRGWAAQRK